MVVMPFLDGRTQRTPLSAADAHRVTPGAPLAPESALQADGRRRRSSDPLITLMYELLMQLARRLHTVAWSKSDHSLSEKLLTA